MRDYKMKKRTPSGNSNQGKKFGGSGSQGKHKPELRQGTPGTTMWWRENAPKQRRDEYTRPKEQVGGGNATGTGPGPRVA